MRQANEILESGDEIVLVMKLKGRDRLHMNEAEIRMNEILKKCDKGREISRKKGENMIIVRLTKLGKIENKTEEKQIE
jgi:translation initiation factor IF-3